MSNSTASASAGKPFKLNIKRTMLIGFAFFGILLMNQLYDSWCPTFLSELFKAEFATADEKSVQYLVGIMMAIDNIAALILMPIFGRISDRTNTKIGKRMPFILVGTAVTAIALPFIPLFFHQHQIVGVIISMAIVVTFGMMYRNPAVSLMPDITPKPLRSKANGIINIMGYVGGLFATVLGIVFVLSDYLNKEANLWIIETPFLVASVLMIISALVLFFTIKENKLAAELKDELDRGEEVAEIQDKITDDDAPLTPANRRMLLLILIAEFFWFMADNGVGTFMGNFTVYYLKCSTASNMINTIAGGVGSVVGFALGGIIAEKIGRKWTVAGGLGLSVIAMAIWALCTFLFPVSATLEPGKGTFPVYIYAIFALKGFGMSLVHINSLPMVVDLCSKKKVGTFTGYYYASSMSAQTITPILLGLLLLLPSFEWWLLPIYAGVLLTAAFVTFLLIKNVKRTDAISTKSIKEKMLEGLGNDD